MQHLLKKFLLFTILKPANPLSAETHYSAYKFAKAYRIFLVNLRRNFKSAVLISIGIFSAAFGFKSFLLTNHFIDGGATGISLLVSALTQIPLYYLIIAVNLPFIVMAYHLMGRAFAVNTVLAVTGLALVLATVNFPNVTNDNLLVAVFGGLFLGAGIGVTIVSAHSEEIRQMIINKLGRGVTVYQGKRGYGKKGETRDVEILYTVITRLEVNKLNTELAKIAPSAFVVMHSVKDTKGGMIKRRPLKH